VKILITNQDLTQAAQGVCKCVLQGRVSAMHDQDLCGHKVAKPIGRHLPAVRIVKDLL
jgi:hypothetical protein